MQFIILFGLAVAWGVLLVPDLLKKRGTVRSIRGVKGFDRQLSAFNRTSGGFTTPTFSTNGGGNSTIQYDSSALNMGIGSATNVSGIREF